CYIYYLLFDQLLRAVLHPPPLPNPPLFLHTATTVFYTLSLPTLFRSRAGYGSRRICSGCSDTSCSLRPLHVAASPPIPWSLRWRSEEHTSELQSRENLVCRLLLEKKKY